MKTLRLATLEWIPYASPSLPENGSAIDLIRRVFQKAGYRIEVTFLPWPRAMAEVEAGKYDLAAPAYPSEHRRQRYGISRSFAVTQLGFFKRRSTRLSLKGLEDLKHYRIGTVRGYSNGETIDLMTDIDKEVVNKDEMNFKKLAFGRIELAVGDRRNGFAVIRKLSAEETDPKRKALYTEIEFVEPPLLHNTLHILVSRKRKDAEKILSDFNNALKALEEEGLRSLSL